jgi:hypothetical protein
MYRIALEDPRRPPADLLALLGSSFREFYSGPPWHERWRCPSCNAPGDYGPTGRYGDKSLSHCPACGRTLEAYWSDERTATYASEALAKPGSWLLVARFKQELVGWIWGYTTSEVQELQPLALPNDYSYVDVICILREYRGQFTQMFVRALQDRLINERATKAIVCRTHLAARPVQLLLRATDWTPLEAPALKDPDRTYWIYKP